MLTWRGIGLLLLSAGAYAAARFVGTYELYLAALAFTVVVVAALVLVHTGGTRLRLERSLDPPDPTAGDTADMAFRLINSSAFPTTPLRIVQRLPSLAGVDLVVDVSAVPGRGSREASDRLPALRRGVFAVEPATVTYTDPLGAARRNRPLGDSLSVTVLPRIVHLGSCAFLDRGVLNRGRRSHPSPSSSSVDLRGVRPHQPGEPLSHIDWKSTARTGTLMLREMEEPGRTDVVLVLDGTRSTQVGEPPEDTFEAGVNVVGSIGDLALREGFAVSLLRHGAVDRHMRFEAGGTTRPDLQMALAEASADADVPLGTCLGGHRTLLRHGLVVIVVSPALDRQTVHELMGLAERGVPVFLAHLATLSFVTETPDARLDPRERAILLQLQASGIPSLTIRRGDDLRVALAAAEGSGSSVGPGIYGATAGSRGGRA